MIEMDSAETESGESGQLIVGSYQLLSIQSRLAECQVWRGLHRPTEMDVVVEVYTKTGDDKALIESIVHKMDRFTQLAGCKILRLLEAIDLEDAILLVYEHYSSQTLMQYAVNCPVKGAEFRRLVKSLLRTVHRLHSRCFFHGTLTNDSFVLTSQKKIKFKDAVNCHLFVQSNLEPSRLDAILSKSTDVWSLGTLIYRLISHQLDSVGAVLPSLAGEENAGQTALIHAVRAMDSDLADLLVRMTDQNPTARISTIDCLRHPYLTRGDPLAAAAAAKLNAAPSSTPSISRDVIRFLSRATGAPKSELAAAAVANDLSGWCAAYWLLRQRLIVGRGFPELADSEDGRDEQPAVKENEVEAEVNPVDSNSESQKEQPVDTKSQSQSKPQEFHRLTIQLLRTRRLGLRSPEPSGSSNQQPPAQPPFATAAALRTARSRDEPLPPISVRSAGQSQRSSRAGAQQLQQHKNTNTSTRRYLAYMRSSQEAPAQTVPTVANRENLPPISPRVSMDTGSAIRVRVQTRTTQERPQQQPVEESQKAQLSQQILPVPPQQLPEQPNRQSTMLSPRQPPNSRVDVGRPGEPRAAKMSTDAAVVTAAAAAAAAAAAVAKADEADAVVDEARPLFVWQNALVRWPQWMQSRAS